mgnify:CR=1 FL=1
MTTASPPTRAFTLIEVLLGVLILGLGLLGLASVFPLVVKQQRQAQDVVLGVSAASGAGAVLRGHTVLNDPSGLRGWAAFSRELHAAARGNPGFQSLWSDVLGGTSVPERLRIYGTVDKIGQKVGEPGSLRFLGSSGTPSNPEVVLYTSDRLLPQGPGVTPQYVWDAVPLLTSSADALIPPEFSPMRVVIFVRRIDPGIRVPTNSTLTDVIASGSSVAIAVDNNGFPTFDGRGSYALPVVAVPTGARQRFRIDAAPFNVLEFSTGTAPATLAAIRQLGQQIVDIDGNIYTVVAVPDERDAGYDPARSVVVAPPFAGQTVKMINGETGAKVQEFLVSPVIPATVEVITIRQ